MSFKILFTDSATKTLKDLKSRDEKKYRKVLKTLGLLEINPRHPGLNTHKYSSFTGIRGEDIYEAYVENRTPAAYRLFWHYGLGKDVITVVAITPHP